MLILQGAISLGLLWSLMAIGVYLTFRILGVPDLSVEGTIILGAAMAASMISQGGNPFVATLLAILVGCAGGLTTGILQTKLRIPPILSGILTMVASYSIVIRIMGTSNVPLPPHGPQRVISVYTFLQEMGLSRHVSIISLGSFVALIVIVLLFWFFSTELGSAIRATGNNRQMVKAQGVNTDAMIILCLMISNGMVGLSGALVAQSQGFASVDMGVGTIVIGLASVIIAEVLFRVRSFWARLVSLVAGAVIYRLIIALVLGLGMLPADLRLFQAITVVIALTLPLIHEKILKLIEKNKSRR
ncbi:MAG: ABC transporter permease [Clostridiales bacterium]|nr:ABC transporter permease [Clostridiales bacterium]